jgi:hypothetical protein
MMISRYQQWAGQARRGHELQEEHVDTKPPFGVDSRLIARGEMYTGGIARMCRVRRQGIIRMMERQGFPKVAVSRVFLRIVAIGSPRGRQSRTRVWTDHRRMLEGQE